MVELRRLDSTDEGFASQLHDLLSRESEADRALERTVAGIIENVRVRGDDALLEYTRKFDRLDVSDAAELELPAERLQKALDGLPGDQRAALEFAAARIRGYAERQKLESWSFTDEYGNRLGQQVRPIDRAGLYVPGGKAAYPSSVLMNAVPAKVAGVRELIMVVPAPGGELNPLVLAAAAVAGVDRVFTVGGAQAVAALAWGTATVPRVDKIVGPGNLYVAEAKRMVFGRVGIDMIAGPSEIVVVSDGGADPDWIAMDLFSQAEHDEQAQAILISPDAAFIERVAQSVERRLPEMERREVIDASLENRGALIRVRDLDEALEVVNRIAPEHLELSFDGADRALEKVHHAGAIFLGRYSAEVLGDYVAGPNHVLPTSGTARFASPLGVYDFQKRSSIIECSAGGADELGGTASILARAEGLTAHARSAEYRLSSKKPPQR